MCLCFASLPWPVSFSPLPSLCQPPLPDLSVCDTLHLSPLFVPSSCFEVPSHILLPASVRLVCVSETWGCGNQGCGPVGMVCGGFFPDTASRMPSDLPLVLPFQSCPTWDFCACFSSPGNEAPPLPALCPSGPAPPPHSQSWYCPPG